MKFTTLSTAGCFLALAAVQVVEASSGKGNQGNQGGNGQGNQGHHDDDKAEGEKLMRGLFKVKPFTFCNDTGEIPPITNETTVEMDIPSEYIYVEESQYGIQSKEEENEDKKIKKAMRVLQTMQFFCAKDIRTLCNVGPEEETCPEVILRECSSCFDGASVKSFECLCDCEDAKPAVRDCTSKRKRHGGNGDNDGKGRLLRRMLDQRIRCPGGKNIGTALNAVAKCLTESWVNVTDVCKEAITAKSNSTNVNGTGSVFGAIGDAAQTFNNNDDSSSGSGSDMSGADSSAGMGAAGIVGLSAGLLVLAGVAAVMINKRRQSQAPTSMVPTAKLVESEMKGRAPTEDDL